MCHLFVSRDLFHKVCLYLYHQDLVTYFGFQLNLCFCPSWSWPPSLVTCHLCNSEGDNDPFNCWLPLWYECVYNKRLRFILNSHTTPRGPHREHDLCEMLLYSCSTNVIVGSAWVWLVSVEYLCSACLLLLTLLLLLLLILFFPFGLLVEFLPTLEGRNSEFIPDHVKNIRRSILHRVTRG